MDKRTKIIIATFIAYIVAMIGMYFGVDQYIKEKDQRLYNEAYSKLASIFSDKQQYVDVLFSEGKVEYDEINLPPKFDNESLIIPQKQEDEHDEYEDVIRRFNLRYKMDSYLGCPFGSGWCLIVTKYYNDDYISESYIFPYEVGYKKQDNSWLYSYMPSVQEAVDNAFEFYTKNENSFYSSGFKKGSYFDDLSEKIRSIHNDYYYLGLDEKSRLTIWSTPLNYDYFSRDSTKTYVYRNDCMFNGLYKVFTATTHPKTYSITKNYGNPDEVEKKELRKCYGVGFTLLFLIIVIPLILIQNKHNKEKNESLYDKLVRMCNPSNYINSKNYNKEKIDKANEIYKKLLEISPDDSDALNEIQHLAISDLGISLINKDKLDELKEKVNPKKYMKPYNAEKVSLANELFAILCKEGLTYNELAEVEERAKLL